MIEVNRWFLISSLACLLHSAFATLLVSSLFHFFLLSVPLVLDFLLTLTDALGTSDTALLLLLVVLFVKVGEALNHRVDLLFLRVHEHLFKGSFRGQSQLGQQICLPTPIDFAHIIEYTDPLFLLKRQLFSDFLWNVQTSEDSLLSGSIELLVVMGVLRVFLAGDG